MNKIVLRRARFDKRCYTSALRQSLDTQPKHASSQQSCMRVMGTTGRFGCWGALQLTINSATFSAAGENAVGLLAASRFSFLLKYVRSFLRIITIPGVSSRRCLQAFSLRFGYFPIPPVTAYSSERLSYEEDNYDCLNSLQLDCVVAMHRSSFVRTTSFSAQRMHNDR